MDPDDERTRHAAIVQMLTGTDDECLDALAWPCVGSYEIGRVLRDLFVRDIETHPRFVAALLDRIEVFDDEWVRARAAKHVLCGAERLTRAFDDPHWSVRSAATENPHLGDDLLPWVRYGWKPAAAERVARNHEPIFSTTIEAFALLADIGMSPAEAWWQI